MAERGTRQEAPGPESFAILLTPGQEQPMLMLQAVFESGIRKVKCTMTIEMPSVQSPPVLIQSYCGSEERPAPVASCE